MAPGPSREPLPASPPPYPRRLLSLDALRGLTVAAMILVNNPGTWRAVYPPLRHADWHGWTLTDVVFPFFVFIVGVAVPVALGPRVERSGRAWTMARVLRRSAVIFGLGIVLNGLRRGSSGAESCQNSTCSRSISTRTGPRSRL